MWDSSEFPKVCVMPLPLHFTEPQCPNKFSFILTLLQQLQDSCQSSGSIGQSICHLMWSLVSASLFNNAEAVSSEILFLGIFIWTTIYFYYIRSFFEQFWCKAPLGGFAHFLQEPGCISGGGEDYDALSSALLDGDAMPSGLIFIILISINLHLNKVT